MTGADLDLTLPPLSVVYLVDGREIACAMTPRRARLAVRDACAPVKVGTAGEEPFARLIEARTGIERFVVGFNVVEVEPVPD